MITRFERFLVSLSGITRSWHKIAATELKKYGLKGTYAIYLVTMLRYPEGVTSASLSDICDRNKADVSRSISELEKKGLLSREDNRSKYRVLIKLTDEGREIAEEVKRSSNIAVEIAGLGISEEKRQIFYDTMELISSNLQNLSKKGIPK
ncbi:MAG: winged helix DNA-binding protein [Clostridia bacterium]|nr:winged helix DNA-binding protein [Clostridia bacterium]